MWGAINRYGARSPAAARSQQKRRAGVEGSEIAEADCRIPPAPVV